MQTGAMDFRGLLVGDEASVNDFVKVHTYVCRQSVAVDSEVPLGILR